MPRIADRVRRRPATLFLRSRPFERRLRESASCETSGSAADTGPVAARGDAFAAKFSACGADASTFALVAELSAGFVGIRRITARRGSHRWLVTTLEEPGSERIAARGDAFAAKFSACGADASTFALVAELSAGFVGIRRITARRGSHRWLVTTLEEPGTERPWFTLPRDRGRREGAADRVSDRRCSFDSAGYTAGRDDKASALGESHGRRVEGREEPSRRPNGPKRSNGDHPRAFGDLAERVAFSIQ